MNCVHASILAGLVVLSAAVAACAPESEPDLASGEDAFSIFGKAPPPMLPADYEAKSGVEKQKLLGAMISNGPYCPVGEDRSKLGDARAACLQLMPTGGFGYLITSLPALFSLHTTFNFSKDEAPEGRKKIFHPFGVAGMAEFVADYASAPTEPGVTRAKPYTGVLANTRKALPLILRMAPGGGSNLIPGASVKFLIDGKPSRNFVAIHDFGGLPKDNWNYFSQDIGHIYPDTPFIIQKFFQTVTNDPSHLPVTNLGEVTPDGADVPAEEQFTPFEIVLRGNPAVATRFENKNQHDFRFDLEQIASGTPVYDVMARATKEDTVFEKIGTIRTRSALVASSGGDKQLYFMHAGAK